MKKLYLLISVGLVLLVLLGADIRSKKAASSSSVTAEKPCFGYTIVEFGTGIDCHGDTVKLVKVKGGGQELARLDQ